MRCHEFDELASPYLSDELEVSRRREVDAHLAGCAACASLLERQLRADELLRSSLAAVPVAAPAVQSRVRARMQAAPWWHRFLEVPGPRVALASVALLIGIALLLRGGPEPEALELFQSAAADHVEDVVERIEKPGWTASSREAEELALRMVGDTRPLGALTNAGYLLARARLCALEGKAQPWLHLIYTRGGREISLFVRSRMVSAGSPGQRALTADLSFRREDALEVVGFQRGEFGMVLVADLSRSEARRIAQAAADSVSAPGA
jgi:anti-sigma factor RsiW